MYDRSLLQVWQSHFKTGSQLMPSRYDAKLRRFGLCCDCLLLYDVCQAQSGRAAPTYHTSKVLMGNTDSFSCNRMGETANKIIPQH